jgi:transcriptional regulator with XRE-family HTH domain
MANNLIELRERAGLTRRQVVEKTGFSGQQLYRCEKIKKSLLPEEVSFFCDLYQCTADEIFSDSPSESPHIRPVESTDLDPEILSIATVEADNLISRIGGDAVTSPKARGRLILEMCKLLNVFKSEKENG